MSTARASLAKNHALPKAADLPQSDPALADVASSSDISSLDGPPASLNTAQDQTMPGREDSSQSGVSTEAVPASGNQSIDGLLAGTQWSSFNLTYSFPSSSADYGTPSTYNDPAPFNGFATLSAAQQADVLRAFGLISSYTTLTFTQITETTSTHATIRLADSSSPVTSYAYTPSTSIEAGDAFYGPSASMPVQGNFASGNSTLHEIGHTLGLKHGQDTSGYGALPANQLDTEYSLMNYPTYIGSTEPYITAERGSSPQSYMMDDIAALQDMYGENLNNVGKTFIYTWSPTTGQEFINGVSQGTPYDNHILETIWTGGATATYNFANYDTPGILDLRPGEPVDFSTAQLADLGYYGTPGPGKIFAQGNIYNTLLYHGDTSTEVSKLISGNGNDIVYANDLLDTISLGSGNDTVYAGSGGATITGGGGTDTLVLSGPEASYTMTAQNGVVAVTDSMTSRGRTETLAGIRYIRFSDQTLDLQKPVAAIPTTAFDAAYYLAHNPDVAAARVDPYTHYETYGWKEGRNPDAYFDVKYYLNQNPDVAAARIDPLTHYETSGWKEGRDPGSNFSTDAYLHANPDVVAAGIDPLTHYLAFGAPEGRMAFIATPHGVGPGNPLVDDNYYFSQYADVRAAGVDPFAHYNANGWKEARNPDALFSTAYYLQQNPDVAASGMDPMLHYEQFGWLEGRDPSAAFSTSKYLAAYSDVKAAGLDPLVHYEQNGMHEGRAIFAV